MKELIEQGEICEQGKSVWTSHLRGLKDLLESKVIFSHCEGKLIVGHWIFGSECGELRTSGAYEREGGREGGGGGRGEGGKSERDRERQPSSH